VCECECVCISVCVCVCVCSTCSSQQGAEANTSPLVLQLHHIQPTGGDQLQQMFPQLQTGEQ